MAASFLLSRWGVARLTLLVFALFFAGLVTLAEDDVDHYAVLGLEEVREDASERDIKTAWRKLSKRYHPDVAGEAVRETYQRIQRAYEVLGDRRKRKVYDILGTDGVNRLEHPQRNQPHPFFHLFGHSDDSGERGGNTELLLMVSLPDIYNGATHTIRLEKQKVCRACRGAGARSKDDFATCLTCGGKGRLVQQVMLAPGFSQTMEQPCPRCGGVGKTITVPCPVCRGKQVVKGASDISVDIEQGIPEGYVMTYEMEGDQAPKQIPGDVIFTIVTAPHELFKRVGDDLHVTVNISLKEALLGFERSITHMDNREVMLYGEGVTQHGTVSRIQGEGMPKHHVPSEKGDLMVTYAVILPKDVSEELRKTIEENL